MLAIDSQLKGVDEGLTNVCGQLAEFNQGYAAEQALQKAANGCTGADQGGQAQEPPADESVAVVDQIRQILRKQMDTLSWVDQQSSELLAPLAHWRHNKCTFQLNSATRSST